MNGLNRSQLYGRMFPPASQASVAEEEDIKRLGEAMIDSGQADKFGTVAGITYFGQFIGEAKFLKIPDELPFLLSISKTASVLPRLCQSGILTSRALSNFENTNR